MMIWILRILLLPIRILLSILTAFLTFVLSIGTTLLYLLILFCIVVAIESFMNGDVAIGVKALIVGFLVSPYGIPMVGAFVIALIEVVNEKLRVI